MYTAGVSEENIASIFMETVCSSATLVPTCKTTQSHNQHKSINVHSFKTSDINTKVSGKPLKKIVIDGYPSTYLHSSLEMCKQMVTAVSWRLMLWLHSQQSQHIVQQCCCCCLMADLGFIPLIFWHPNIALIVL